MSTRRIAAGALIAVVLLAAGGLAWRHPRSVNDRVRLLGRKLSGEAPPVTWRQLAVLMAPHFWRPRMRDLLQPTSPSWVAHLDDYPPQLDQPFAMHQLLNGPTGVMEALDCHYSVLEGGLSPHPPHVHVEEELIIPVTGRVRIIRVAAGGERSESVLERGDFAYHASNQAHTIEAAGTGFSTYLVLKWKGRWVTGGDDQLASRDFEFRSRLVDDADAGFDIEVLFESKTAHLGTLHAHLSAMRPGAGYGAHGDAHDVVILVLEGAVETLGQSAGPNSVIFYPADSLHGIGNPGEVTARYLVFEFHAAVGL